MKICKSFLLKTLKTFNSITAAIVVTASGVSAAENISEEKTITKRDYTWEEFKGQVVDLANKLKAYEQDHGMKWEGIIPVASGGLTPSHHLGKLLGIKRFQNFCTYSYENCTQGKSTTYDVPNIPEGGKNWIVVDDMGDTGHTIKEIREHFPNAYYVTLIVKPKALSVVDLYAKEVPQNEWSVYPWEKLFGYD